MDRKSGELTNEVKNIIVSLKIENPKVCEFFFDLFGISILNREVWKIYLELVDLESCHTEMKTG